MLDRNKSEALHSLFMACFIALETAALFCSCKESWFRLKREQLSDSRKNALLQKCGIKHFKFHMKASFASI